MSIVSFLPHRCVECGEPIDGDGTFAEDAITRVTDTVHDRCRRPWQRPIETINVSLR